MSIVSLRVAKTSKRSIWVEPERPPETTLHPTPAIFATEKDAEHIQELLGDGVVIEIRQVPNDAKVFAKDVF